MSLLSLLIAPYGIEMKLPIPILKVNELLIAPYGIEISKLEQSLCFLFLLIAPYGIEMDTMSSWMTYQDTFNCTLWN